MEPQRWRSYASRDFCAIVMVRLVVVCGMEEMGQGFQIWWGLGDNRWGGVDEMVGEKEVGRRRGKIYFSIERLGPLATPQEHSIFIHDRALAQTKSFQKKRHFSKHMVRMKNEKQNERDEKEHIETNKIQLVHLFIEWIHHKHDFVGKPNWTITSQTP